MSATDPRAPSSARGYDTQWRKARRAFLSDHPLCAICEAQGRIVEASVVDHIVPHRGDRSLFWSRSNWQPLCAPCHNRTKQAEERAGYSEALDADGWPVDPRHPANRWEGGSRSSEVPEGKPVGTSRIELVRPGGAGPGEEH